MVTYFSLLREFVVADFKIRYQDSLLGYLWSLVKPLLMFGTLYVVFSLFLRFDVPHYPVYLFLGIILWNFFVEATTSSMRTMLQRGDLMKKIYFPRELIVYSAVGSSFVTLAINLVVFAVFFLISGVPLYRTAIVFPVFLLDLLLVSLGGAMMLSALNVKLRDLTHIWDILLQLGFWATPIVYSIAMVPQKYHFWLFLNPMTRIIQYSRNVVVEGIMPTFGGMSAALLFSLAMLVIGYLVFKKMEPTLAEEF